MRALETEYNPETLLGSDYLLSGARTYLEKYPSVKRLALAIVGRRRRGSPRTVSAYLAGIQSLSTYLGLSPEEILQQAREKRLDLVKRINSEGDGWIDNSLNAGKSNKTLVLWVAAVKRWTEVNDLELDWKKVEPPNSAVVKNRDRSPSPVELNRLLSFSDVKETAAISLLATSGLRIGTLLTLRWKELDFDFKPDVVKLRVEREIGRKFGKIRETNGDGIEFFITFGSTKTREAMLNYRKSLEVTGHEGGALAGPECYVFPASARVNKPMKLTSFQWRWYRLIERAGLTKKSVDRYEIRVHSLRKYFRSRASGLDPSTREYMLGHKGAYLDASYFRKTDVELYEEYKQVMDRLEVEVGVAEQEVNALKKQVASLQAQLEERDRKFIEYDRKLAEYQAGVEKRLEHLTPKP